MSQRVTVPTSNVGGFALPVVEADATPPVEMTREFGELRPGDVFMLEVPVAVRITAVEPTPNPHAFQGNNQVTWEFVEAPRAGVAHIGSKVPTRVVSLVPE